MKKAVGTYCNVLVKFLFGLYSVNRFRDLLGCFNLNIIKDKYCLINRIYEKIVVQGGVCPW